jgi:biopolymer transport protein ExbB/TolQ
MSAAVGLKQLLSAGGPVLLFLIALSIYSIALILQRWNAFRRFGRQVDDAGLKLRQAARGGELDKAFEGLKGTRNPVYLILQRTASAQGDREERRGLTSLSISRQLNQLQHGLGTLGTIASVSPFIGLFGTILGVMRAFRDLAAYQGAGPGVVAVGIAEALVTTAAGLFVAIPAVAAYNFFNRRSQELADELNWIAEDMLEHLPGA